MALSWLSHSDTIIPFFGDVSCTKFPHDLPDSLVWLIATAKMRFVSCEPTTKALCSSANRHQYCRSPGKSLEKVFPDLLDSISSLSTLRISHYTESSRRFVSVSRPLRMFAVHHEGFYDAAEPYPAFRRVHLANECHILSILLGLTSCSHCTYGYRRVSNFAVFKSFDPLRVAIYDNGE